MQTQSPTIARRKRNSEPAAAHSGPCANALAAAYVAIADGEALIRQTQEHLRLEPRAGFGPRMLEWLNRERDLRRPKPRRPELAFDGGETYYLAEAEIPVARAVVAMLALARLTNKPGLRKAAYADIGRHLAALRRGRDRSHFADLVKVECGLSVRRAYEFMAMASGGKAIEKLRFETKVRVRKARQNKGMGEKAGIRRGSGGREMAA